MTRIGQGALKVHTCKPFNSGSKTVNSSRFGKRRSTDDLLLKVKGASLTSLKQKLQRDDSSQVNLNEPSELT